MKFKVGDLVTVKENSIWYDFIHGAVGKVVLNSDDMYGVDFGQTFQYCHNLDGAITNNTGLYLSESNLILYKSKGGNYNEY